MAISMREGAKAIIQAHRCRTANEDQFGKGLVFERLTCWSVVKTVGAPGSEIKNRWKWSSSVVA